MILYGRAALNRYQLFAATGHGMRPSAFFRIRHPYLKTHRHILLGIHAALATLLISPGLMPKILVQAPDELRIWALQAVNADYAAVLMQISDCAEIIFGLLFFILRKSLRLHALNLLAMLLLSGLIV